MDTDIHTNKQKGEAHLISQKVNEIRKNTAIANKWILPPAYRKFLQYIVTLNFYELGRQRISHDIDKYKLLEGFAYVPNKVLEQRFFVYPDYSRKIEMAVLVELGLIEINETESINFKDKKLSLYKCKEPNNFPKDVTLLKNRDPKNWKDYDTYKDLYKFMQSALQQISLPDTELSTEYFDFFLQHKNERPDIFFHVDKFAGRVHTPYSNLIRGYRPNILLNNESVTSFDVWQMQPMILGRILTLKIGANEFSEALQAEKDIYVMIQHKANLESRDKAKKRFFEILFSRPNNSLVELFGAANWITWINDFKSLKLEQNPQNDNKRHNNLAWALQTMEVRTMRKVWQGLKSANIGFLSVHDEITVQSSKADQAEQIFKAVLDTDLPGYKLNRKE